MQKILVPVDFSEYTGITIQYALELAMTAETEVRLFHTYFDQIILADTSYPDTLDMTAVYNEELMKEIYRQAEQKIRELTQKVTQMIAGKEMTGVSVSSTLVGGEIEHELKVICKEYHPDLVVMGTCGKGNNLNVWGKVSTYIIDHAGVPVFTIPRINEFRGFRNIMFSADLREENAIILHKLLDLFKPFHSTIHVVHFLVPSRKKDEPAMMKILENEFGPEVNSGKIGFSLVEMEGENYQIPVDQFIHDKIIDVIAFQPQKRSLLSMFFAKNITKKNLFATNTPLLAIPSAG